MEQADLIWTESFPVRAYEAGIDGRVKIQAIFNYLQESAANHAIHLGVFGEKLSRMNLTWVMSRIHLQVKHYPFWKQAVHVETWPVSKQGLHAIRDFKLTTDKGNEVGVATSSWMMIDVKRRKAIAMPAFMDGIELPSRPRALIDPFERLPRIEQVKIEKEFRVRLSDLDLNQHVNSVVYLDWALEAIPLEILQSHRLSGLEINYRAESCYGDRILSQSSVSEANGHQVIYHSLVRKKDSREVTRLVSRWQAK